MTATTFKPGDRVSTKGAAMYPDGTEFTVTAFTQKRHKALPRATGYASGDPKGWGVWNDSLELVEPADDATPPAAEYADPRHESLIRQVEDPQAVIRRRNEQIVKLQTKGDRLNVLRALQADIGKANAEKGFHAEGREIRDQLDSVRAINRNGGLTDGPNGKPETEQRWDAVLRNYYTARLALITTEVAEAIEELRNGRQVDETWYSGKRGGNTYSGTREEVESAGAQPKPEGVPSEIADVVIRAFDFADEAGFDLARIIEEKLAYNATRPAMHGRKF